jgi:hypothetical protein
MTQLGIATRSLPGTTGKWLTVVDAQRLVTAAQETTRDGATERPVLMPRATHDERISEVIYDRIEARRIRVAAYLIRTIAIIDIAALEWVGRRTVTRDVQVIRQEWDLFRALGQDALREARRVADSLGIGSLLSGFSPFRGDLLAACFTIAEGRQQLEDVAREIARFQARVWPSPSTPREAEREAGTLLHDPDSEGLQDLA